MKQQEQQNIRECWVPWYGNYVVQPHEELIVQCNCNADRGNWGWTSTLRFVDQQGMQSSDGITAKLDLRSETGNWITLKCSFKDN